MPAHIRRELLTAAQRAELLALPNRLVRDNYIRQARRIDPQICERQQNYATEAPDHRSDGPRGLSDTSSSFFTRVTVRENCAETWQRQIFRGEDQSDDHLHTAGRLSRLYPGLSFSSKGGSHPPQRRMQSPVTMAATFETR
jgi:hypothetical protein